MYNSTQHHPTATLYPIPNGHAGIEATVRHMRRVRRQALAHPIVRDAAERIVGNAGGAKAARRVRRFLASRVAFQHDPLGVELIRTPRFMLREIEADGWTAGDCDDVAVLGAALGMAAGLGARYVLVGLTPGEPFEHVYTVLFAEDGAVELDTTRPAQFPPGVKVLKSEYREA